MMKTKQDPTDAANIDQVLKTSHAVELEESEAEESAPEGPGNGSRKEGLNEGGIADNSTGKEGHNGGGIADDGTAKSVNGSSVTNSEKEPPCDHDIVGLFDVMCREWFTPACLKSAKPSWPRECSKCHNAFVLGQPAKDKMQTKVTASSGVYCCPNVRIREHSCGYALCKQCHDLHVMAEGDDYKSRRHRTKHDPKVGRIVAV